MKASDEQIRELVEKGLNNRKIALELGLIPSGNFNNRCRELRKNNGVTESSRKRGRPERAKTDVIESTVLKFEDVRKDDRLMKGNKRLVVVAVGEEGLSYRTMDGSIKFLHRKEFEKNAAEYKKVPPGDPQGAPVKIYIDPTQKLSAGDIKVNGQPIKNLPDKVKEKIVEKLKEKAAPEAPIIPSLFEERKPGMTINPEFEAAVQEMVEQTAENPKVVDEGNGYSKIVRAESKPEPDYIDPEWGLEIGQPFRNRVMSKAMENVLKHKSIGRVLIDCINTGKHLPLEILNEYESLIQETER